ncbi:hypothetical protein Riv7116_0495 [Rivularia sp. PCC 7116]|uniref:hypothetical protein n=1 Tax=Rivularia sp. PCC 7116 TaxID=373994 RepID=UPI00029F072D|nr:hypothetical protein [Rivularia sp. PCC 7116]AFY53093.1 hypothetical protein Riv7116_0495 [Rivularia sp. PCC 7116]
MTDIRKLINKLATEEKKLCSTEFIAPCVGKGKVLTRIAGITYSFIPKPENFEGWGIFQPINSKQAAFVEEPNLPLICEYLKNFQPLRLRLVYPLRGQTWLAYAINEADMLQRCGYCKPVPVHLIAEAGQFEVVIARTDGAACWFEECDRRGDVIIAQRLREQLEKLTPPQDLHFKGMTPEMLTAYNLATQQAEEFSDLRRQQRDEKRLQEALKMAGGELQQWSDRQDYWVVEWFTSDGEQHTSAISKNDLTVMSAGICLSGEDEKFDLQSLVGVVERRDLEDY